MKVNYLMLVRLNSRQIVNLSGERSKPFVFLSKKAYFMICFAKSLYHMRPININSKVSLSCKVLIRVRHVY